MKKYAILLVAVLSIVFLASCGAKEPADDAAPLEASGEGENGAAAGMQEKSFGSYIIPEGWVESPELSSDGKFFYLKEGTKLDVPTSNISVEFGENKYAESEHELFREAILQQLLSQAQNGYTLSGGGSTTESGYIVYAFTLANQEDANATTTKQYYIVGDYQYVFVHVTDFHDASIPDVDEAAKMIVEGFTWQEE